MFPAGRREFGLAPHQIVVARPQDATALGGTRPKPLIDIFPTTKGSGLPWTGLGKSDLTRRFAHALHRGLRMRTPMGLRSSRIKISSVTSGASSSASAIPICSGRATGVQARNEQVKSTVVRGIGANQASQFGHIWFM